ncbi:Sterol 3-beta-glucosyltransferase [Trichoderma asperellum]|uniref:Sterol 3-beta-glucosyltransferase n=1 Tax=Trichoderma asperellum (strain ATCC 204424 / CBS 433.97 / NBRC 101777) TaxID=1042311 RepID=A0A2T3YYI3_TRIA4|nr:glycosyltransferase family 1 protein [Trichoderma asperellum CBS 433.97]PTB37584.1 glycosyltransferase family 1 protein [Trichoderma asperellum CBS 433.97]UKZ90522.1 Sterol 3-beta-glucosyltransferase [Trichoderma asperellum]
MATTPTPRRGSLGGDDDAGLPHIGETPAALQRDDSTLTAELPEPLQGSDDDTSENVGFAQTSPMAVNMNQSIFGLIAAAGSRVDFNTRFDDGSSDEDDDEAEGEGSRLKPLSSRHRDLSQTAILGSFPAKDKRLGHKKKLSGHRLLKSFASLPRRKSKPGRGSKMWEPTEEVDEQSESSEPPSPKKPSQQLDEEEDLRVAPVMSRMLEAQAEMASRSSFDIDIERDSSGPDRTDEGEEDREEEGEGSHVTALARRLMEIFEFDEPERVIEEYPCWLLKSVLLQGYLYITSKHICFYAYLPKKTHSVAKSGYLSKSGKRNPKYSRYWFRLKGDVLSYYQDSTNLYFPHGHIDLSFGISASITDRDKEGVHFSVVTSHRTYNFRAESAPSAKEWVKSLQRVIFRSHNDGDSVKISIPINDVIDVEDSQMMEFSDTCKIRVMDSDETFAIDEYFFSFFNYGKEAINVIKLLVEDASLEGPTAGKAIAKQEEESSNQSSPRASGSAFRNLTRVDSALTTKLSGLGQAAGHSTSRSSTSPNPYPSGDDGLHSSFDAIGRERDSHDESSRERSSDNKRSESSHQGEERISSKILESSESNLYSSMEEPSFASLNESAFEDPSASQILRGSDVFQNPTMRHSQSSIRDDKESKDLSDLQPADSTAASHAEGSGYAGSIDLPRVSTPTLQSITRMGAYPLQRAGAFADYLNKTSKRMSTLLATESMGYVEKVSGMWKGERKHYDEPAGLRPDEDDLEEDDDGQIKTSNERFRAHFALPATERLQATYFGYIMRVLPLYGKIYLSGGYFCFRSLLPGTRTKLILPLKDIENAHKEKGFRFGYSGLVVIIRGHEELFFEFRQAEIRDDCAVTLLQCLEIDRNLQGSGLLSHASKEEASAAIAEREALKLAGQEMFANREPQLPQSTAAQTHAANILGDDLETSVIQFKAPHSMRITCLTIGSRGDVQPYIALCKGLLADGHRPKIATHAEFQGWIESHGIEFACVEGDPGELMRLCIENGTFTLSFLREANATFRGWLDDLLDSAYKACEGSELLIESPSAMAGIHIAEKLGIPYFRAFTMPWTRTRAYPHAFIMPENKMGGAYNYMTYVMFDNIFWKATAHQVNRWRNKTLGLPNTGLEKMQPNKVPFLYNFSPSVVAPPLDFSDWVRVTGYWFLDEGGDYEPPQELRDFIQKARADGKKIVYVGFGSIIVNDPVKMTQEVIDAILKADVRCILSKGWSDRITGRDEPNRPLVEEPVMPPEIHVIKSAPHDWLFRQIDAAAHHGGSGTTGASLRAGIPTIIRPFFGDQFFFASRVEDLGVGVWVKKWGTKSFGRALWEVTRNERMIVKARQLGEQIRRESGVQTAIQSIYRDMEYAKSLIKHTDGHLETEEDEDTEESWTFVRGDEPDPDVITTKLSEGLDGVALGNNSKASGKS